MSLPFYTQKDDKYIIRSNDLLKQIKNKFGKVNKALEENQKLILNFNPRIYIGEDGNETDNDFDD